VSLWKREEVQEVLRPNVITAERLFAAFLVGLLVLVLWAVRRDRREAKREKAFDGIIAEASIRHHVSPFLVKAVIRKESSFNPQARGAAGEIGLMQITDGAIKEWEKHTGRRAPAAGMFFDPRLNIEVGTWYLGRGLQRWRGYRDCEVLALAQYNAGPTHARRWAPDDPREKALDRIRFPMTRDYIGKVLEYRLIYERDFDGRAPE